MAVATVCAALVAIDLRSVSGQTPPGSFAFAVYATGTGCGAIRIGGRGYVDSVDASQRSDRRQESGDDRGDDRHDGDDDRRDDDDHRPRLPADVGVGGNIDLFGDSTIYGRVFAPNVDVGRCRAGVPGITLSGESRITGGYVRLAPPPAFPPPASVTPGSKNYAYVANATLVPGSYGNISVAAEATLTLLPGTYSINSLTVTGRGAIAPSGRVVINVAGLNTSRPIDLGGRIANTSRIASNLQLNYGGSGLVTLTGGSQAFGVLYAPRASVKLAGEADWFGALVVGTLDDTGGTAIHYDRSLAAPPAPATTTTALATVPDSSLFGQSVALTATVTSGAGTPSGSVTFKEGATVLAGPIAIDATGRASVLKSDFAVGAHAITAEYGGSAAFAPSASTATQTVTRASTTVAVTSSANPSLVGQAVTFTATVTVVPPGAGAPSGSVVFFNGGVQIGNAPLNGSQQATLSTNLLAAGVHAITASYGGDASFAASASAPLSQTIARADTTETIVSSLNPSTAGQAVTFTATLAVTAPGSGGPTGTVTFLDGSTPLGSRALAIVNGQAAASFETASLSIGAHTIVASYGGDGSFNASVSSAVTQTVSAVPTTTTVVADAIASVFGQIVTFTATVADSGPDTPAGSVTFVDGSTTLGTAPLDAGGHAAIAVATLAVGSHAVSARYPGDGVHAASTSAAATATVGRANTSTIVTSPINPSTAGQTVTLSAAVSAVPPGSGTPTGSVVFSDGATAIGSASIAMVNGQTVATLSTSSLSVSVHSITASYGGDGDFNASASSPFLETVIAAPPSPTTTSISSSVTSSAYGQPVTFTADVSSSSGDIPTGMVTFKDGDTTIGVGTLAVVGGRSVAALGSLSLAIGTHAIAAVYGGDTEFAGSTSAPVTQTVAQATTNVALISSANPSTAGQPLTLTATVNVVAPGGGTPTGTVTFLDGGAPLGTAALAIVNSQAVATFASSSLVTASHTVTASYAGDANFAASASSALVETVVAPTPLVTPTTTALAAALNPSTYGQAVALTAEVGSTSGGTPTGTVTFRDGAVLIGTAPLASAGGHTIATFSTSALGAGAHALTAVYAGDAAFGGSTSAAVAENVNKAAATILVNGFAGTYDGGSHAASGSARGVRGEDLAGLLALGATFTDVPGGIAHWTFAGNANYMSASGDAAITIGQADATIRVNGFAGPYDTAPHGAIGTAIGVRSESLSALLHLGQTFVAVPGGVAHWTFDGNTDYRPAAGDATITIRPGPTAVIGGGPFSAATGQQVSFDGSSSSDPDGNPLVYAWSFGDGTTATGASTGHAYTGADRFTTTLRVTSRAGGVGVASVSVSVTQTNRAPLVSAGGPYVGDAGLPVSLAGRASDPDADPITLSWDLGDGTAASGLTPVHTYAAQGSYIVALTADDGRGGVTTATASVTIGAPVDRTPPIVKLSAPATALPGAHLTVTASANDNVGVASVTFDVTGAATTQVPAPPYERVIDVPALAAPGTVVTVKATARDASNNAGSDQVTIRVVAAPDASPPTVAIHLPPQASPGSTVVVTATAADDVGVNSVVFSTAGVPFSTAATPPYSATFVVPRDTAAGSTLTFVARAIDFAGNKAESSGDLPIVAAPDVTPPTVNLVAPDSVDSTATLHLTASAVDDVAVAEVAFIVDGVVVQRAISAPYAADVPVTAPGGSVLRLRATAKDSSGNEASSEKITRVLASPTGQPAVVTGRVYDDTTGLPLSGATVALEGTDASGRAYDQTATSDSRGEYHLEASGGEGTVHVAFAGWTRVDRAIVIPDAAAAVVFDARLTPLGATQAVAAVLGGSLSTSRAVAPSADIVDATLNVAAGAVSTDATIALSIVGPQGLEGPLPAGWSPVGVVDIAPHGIAFNGPQAVATANRLGVPAGTHLVLAFWDEAAVSWRSAGAVDASSAARLTGSVMSTGQWAWLLADAAPAAPPAPADGAPLDGVEPVAIPDPAAVAITPQPRVMFYQPGVSSNVGAVVQTRLSSGTPVRVKLTESYQFDGAAEVHPDPFRQDFVVYQGAPQASAVSAGFVVTPSMTFDPTTFQQGSIAVELDAPSTSTTLPTVGGDGGTVTAATGESIDIAPGAFGSRVPVAIERTAGDAIGVALPAGLTLVGAVTVGFGGAVPVVPAALSIPRPDDVDGFSVVVVLRVVQIAGATRLQFVGTGRVVGSRIVSAAAVDGAATQLDGIAGAGRYVFARGTNGLGFVAGSMIAANGNPVPRGLAATSAPPIVALADAAGRYVIPAPPGPATVTGQAPLTSESGSATGTVISAAVTSVDLHLTPFVFTVTSLTPVDGAAAVALSTAVVATFSSAVDPATAAGPVPIQLAAPDGTTIAGTATLSNGNTRLTFRPASTLAPNTAYTAVVSSGIRDAIGQALSGAASARFSTISTTAPPPPPAANITASIPDGGTTTVTATAGTADPHATVSIVNVTQHASCPALVDASGGFTATCAAATSDTLQVVITDASRNQTTVPLPPFTRTNADGSVATVVGSGGGRAVGPAGIAVDVPPTAVPDGTIVTIQSLDEASFPVQLNAEQRSMFTFIAGLHLDFGGVSPLQYVNVSIPTRGGEPLDRRWVVAEAATVGAGPMLNVVDTAKVIDGRITTASPPCPGIVATSSYAFIQAEAALSAGYGRMVDPNLGSFESIDPSSPLFAQGGAVGAAPTPDSCYPFLARRVSVLPNTQRVVLAASSFTPLDREIVVRNNRLQQDYHYPRNVAQYRFLVPGRTTDKFTVAAVVNGTEQPVTAFDIDSAPAGFVNVRLDISHLNLSITEVIVRNQTPPSGVAAESVFPQSTADVNLPVPGGAADPLDVTIVDANGGARVVAPKAVLPPNGPENLVARALAGSIDTSRPYSAFVESLDPDDHTKVLNTVQLPPSAVVDGGFSFPFDGDLMTEAFQVRVEYPQTDITDTSGQTITIEARTDAFIVPRVLITVADKTTGQVVNTVALPIPPPDDPYFPLGSLSGDHTPPTIVSTPPGLSGFDTSDLLSFTFSEGIDRLSAIHGVNLVDDAGNTVDGEVRLTNGNRTVTFVPSAPLHLATNYSIAFQGLKDGSGNLMKAKTISFATYTPKRSVPVMPFAMNQLQYLTLLGKPGPGGTTQILGFGITGGVSGAHAVAVLDLTNPTQPSLLSTIPMGDGGRVTVVPGVTDLQVNDVIACGSQLGAGGGKTYGGDLAIVSNFDVNLGSAVRYYDVTNPASPCPIGDVLGAKLLTISPKNLGTIGSDTGTPITLTPDGAIPSYNGFARGVAALQNDTQLTSYIAVENVGLMMVDVGSHIPPVPPTSRELEPYISGNYVDVVAANGRLLAVEKSEPRLDIFDGSLTLLASTTWTSGLSLHSALGIAYADAVPFDLNRDGQIDSDEIRNLAFVGGDGGVAIVDVTDLTSPSQVGFVPIDGVIYQMTFDPERRRIFASGVSPSPFGDFMVFAIDLSGPDPFSAIDANNDGVDDRIVFTTSTGNPITASNYRALYYDDSTGTLLVGTTAGYEMYRFGNLSGVATYTYYPLDMNTGIDYAHKEIRPIRNAIVDLLDASGTVLDSTTTGDDGYYAFYAPLRRKIEVVVRAALGPRGSETAKVIDNTQRAWQTAMTTGLDSDGNCKACPVPDRIIWSKSSGQFTMTARTTKDIYAETVWSPPPAAGGLGHYTKRDGAPFAVLDTVYTAQTALRSATPSVVFPLLHLGWSPDNRSRRPDDELYQSYPGSTACRTDQKSKGASSDSASAICASLNSIENLTRGRVGEVPFYDPTFTTLFLHGKENVNTDEYDRVVVLHEWSHYFQDKFSRDDTIAGFHGEVRPDFLDPTVSFSEGFATAFGATLGGDSRYIDTYGRNQGKSGVRADIDRGCPGRAGDFSKCPPLGFWSEDAVQQLLWHLADPTGPISLNGVPATDGVQLTVKPIYDAMVDPVRRSAAWTTVFSLLHAVLAGVTDPGVKSAIVSLAATWNIDLAHADEYDQSQDPAGKASRLIVPVPVNNTPVSVFPADFIADPRVLAPLDITDPNPLASQPLTTSTRRDGAFSENKLLERVFFRFDVPSPGDCSFTITPLTPLSGVRFQWFVNGKRDQRSSATTGTPLAVGPIAFPAKQTFVGAVTSIDIQSHTLNNGQFTIAVSCPRSTPTP